MGQVLTTLGEADEQVALVGGCVRDLLRGGQPTDWDVATSALPERVVELFPDSTWQNPFGTVTVRTATGPVEVTTFRAEWGYLDGRRPSEIRWGDSLTDDLARRDFTINAMAWRPTDAGQGEIVDPHGGQADLASGVVRAVGQPEERFAEDALRLLRAVRFSATLSFALDPATAAAIRRLAPTAARLSGERVRDELLRMLAAPTAAYRLLEDLGLLTVVLPEVAALRGVPQGKPVAGDALDHSLRTAEALPAGDALLRLAGLLHDLGKADTLVDGHFLGHDRRGAELAVAAMDRLRFARTDIDRVSRLIGHHMFAYRPDWTDAAVRRFVRRIGPGQPLADLVALRRADTAASGIIEPAEASLDALLVRIQAVTADAPMSTADLAVDGHDLMAALGLPAGPQIGQLLADLLEAVTDEPSVNTREQLLALARARLRGDETHQPRPADPSGPA